MMLRKLVSLAAVLGRDPREFVHRVGAIAAGRIEPWRHERPVYDAVEWDTASLRLRDALGPQFEEAQRETSLQSVEDDVRRRLDALRGGPISDRHNGDFLFGRCCYAVVRALQPEVVVETGVAHGVSSAYILAALDRNGSGHLHSIDLPPHDHGAQERIGAAVSDELRARWTLHRGTTRDLLRRLLAEVGSADLFVHDSDHTYANMSFEFSTVWDQARVVIADDVELNRAFAELADRGPRLHLAVRQAVKDSLFGIVVR